MKPIWSTLPWYIKYPLLIAGLLIYAPSWVSDKFDSRWDAKAAPHIRERDLQFKALENDLAEIKQDTRDIKLILMKQN